jgi:hypothetical protein
VQGAERLTVARERTLLAVPTRLDALPGAVGIDVQQHCHVWPQSGAHAL